MYMTDQTTTAPKMAEDDDVAKDVSFTFTGNTYENPLAMAHDNVEIKEQKENGGGAVEGAIAMAEDDDDSVVKVDLSAHVDDEEMTKL